MAGAVDDARRVLARSRALPVIFVGSGFSRRYYNTPDWDSLLSHFAERTGKSLTYYRSRTSDADRPDQPVIASMIEDDFIEIWWHSDEYAESRDVYGKEGREKIYPLKIEMAKYISDLHLVGDEALRDELGKLAKARVHSVITTNWDCLLETVFPEFPVFVGQDEVLFSETYGVAEIYKIHGSVVQPSSIVVTKSDYESFQRKNSYLVAKLLTMFVEHPVMFIGYSMGDPHIQEMFREIVNCLSSDKLRILNERIIFIGRPSENRPEALVSSTFNVGSQHLQAFDLRVGDFGSVYQMLSTLNEYYPAKLLRRLRRDVYRLAYETRPSKQIAVAEMDDSTDLDKVEVVIGIGKIKDFAEVGYSAMDRQKLVEFMLDGEMDHDSELLLDVAIPRIFRGITYAPIYYPLFVAGRLDSSGNPTETLEKCPNGQKILEGITELRPYLIKDKETYSQKSFRELLVEGPRIAAGYGAGCKYEVTDVVALRAFLRENTPESMAPSSAYWTLACKYDSLAFGPDFVGDRVALHQALGIARSESAEVTPNAI